ncbi:hypothetical protein KJ359_011008, partial [Pestalotiopsis sp. 9143b]
SLALLGAEQEEGLQACKDELDCLAAARDVLTVAMLEDGDLGGKVLGPLEQLVPTTALGGHEPQTLIGNEAEEAVAADASNEISLLGTLEFLLELATEAPHCVANAVAALVARRAGRPRTTGDGILGLVQEAVVSVLLVDGLLVESRGVGNARGIRQPAAGVSGNLGNGQSHGSDNGHRLWPRRRLAGLSLRLALAESAENRHVVWFLGFFDLCLCL